MSIKMGIIGLDTSHVILFAKAVYRSDDPYYISGGQIVAAYLGGSPDFELSITRVEGFTQELRDNYNVEIVDSPEEVAKRSDAILLLSPSTGACIWNSSDALPHSGNEFS